MTVTRRAAFPFRAVAAAVRQRPHFKCGLQTRAAAPQRPNLKLGRAFRRVCAQNSRRGNFGGEVYGFETRKPSRRASLPRFQMRAVAAKGAPRPFSPPSAPRPPPPRRFRRRGVSSKAPKTREGRKRETRFRPVGFSRLLSRLRSSGVRRFKGTPDFAAHPQKARKSRRNDFCAVAVSLIPPPVKTRRTGRRRGNLRGFRKQAGVRSVVSAFKGPPFPRVLSVSLVRLSRRQAMNPAIVLRDSPFRGRP